MARAPNVVLQFKDLNPSKPDTWQQFNANDGGLVDFTFNRYLGDTLVQSSGVISDVNLTIFDITGFRLLSMFQANQGEMRLSYGFEDDMSPVYDLNIIKFKSTFNNLGCMASVGAIGTQVSATFGPKYYKRGVRVYDILLEIATRNNWSLGEEGGTEGNKVYSNIAEVGDIRLINNLFLEPGVKDIDFIKNEILPLCNQVVTNAGTTIMQFWEVRLFNIGSKLSFYFRKAVSRSVIHKVWNYYYGTNTDSSVISLTNTIDYSFLLRGLTIQIPMPADEYYASLDTDVITEYQNQIFNNNWAAVESAFRDINLPIPNKDQFVFKVELVKAENTGATPLETRIYESIKNAVMSVNTIELVVIGNPNIIPTDIIHLEVKNKDGIDNIVTGNWRVIKISEKIGVGGYSTTMGLVRDLTKIQIMHGV